MISRRNFGIAAWFLLASAGPAADVAGTWSFKVTSPQGEHLAKLTVTQEGEKITGSFSSQRGEFKVEGAVKGAQIQFTVHYTGGDAPASIPFQGKVDGNKMTGDYRAGDTTGAWTAEKEK